MNETGSGQGMGLAYEASLPIRWVARHEPADASFLAGINLADESVLRVLLSLDESHPEANAESESGVAHELSRLEFKVNLALDLLSELLASQLHLPAAVPVRVTGTHVEWQTDASPAVVGDRVLVDLYWSVRYPRPLKLAGVVESIDRGERHTTARMRIDGLTDANHEMLEKLIFRHHRRQIASNRAHRA